MWIDPTFDNATTYPPAQINVPYQAFAASQTPQTMQLAMSQSSKPDSWQQHEVPGLEDDASPSAEGSPDAYSGVELVGLGLYDKTVRTSTDLLGLEVKSLKLTEGWAPPEEQSQASSIQGSSYASPAGHYDNLPLGQQKPSAMTAQQGYPFEFSDHSFLFNDDFGTWYDAQHAGASSGVNGMPYYG